MKYMKLNEMRFTIKSLFYSAKPLSSNMRNTHAFFDVVSNIVVLPLKGFWVTVIFMTISACTHMESREYSAVPSIEYIAHASFRLTDVDGTSIVLDPYNSRMWLGYGYPNDLQADALLITHPHFDHDADYYFDPQTPVYRNAEAFNVGKMQVRGIALEHAGAVEILASGGSAKNTAWLLDVSGIRILHMGDARSPTEAELRNIGEIDVLISNLISRNELARIKAALNASTVIPMHYRLPSVTSDGGKGMKTLAEWLDTDVKVTKLSTNIIALNELEPGIVTFQPRQGLRPWPPKAKLISDKMMIARKAMQSSPANLNEAERQLQSALALDPGDFSIYSFLAYIYRTGGDADKASAILETGLIKATDLDRSVEYRSRVKLATTYVKLGKRDKARSHYMWIAKQPKEYGPKAHQAAADFLSEKTR